MVLNNYSAPAPLEVKQWHIDTPESEYDVNYLWEAPAELSTDGVLMVPYVQSLHSAAFHSQLMAHSSMLRHLPYPPVNTLAQWCTVMETCRSQPGTLLFAIFDQSLTFDTPPPAGQREETRLERLAGITGVHKSDAHNRQTEIGHVLTLPPFHRSHITTHSAALLLNWAFDSLKLRRVQWFAHSENLPSINAARRLGFNLEGILKWDRVLPLGKEGEKLVGWEEEEKRGLGRHSACLSQGWDEWNAGNRAKVAALVARPVNKRTVADLAK